MRKAVDQGGTAYLAPIEGGRGLSKKSFTTNGGYWRKELYNYCVLDYPPNIYHPQDPIICLPSLVPETMRRKYDTGQQLTTHPFLLPCFLSFLFTYSVLLCFPIPLPPRPSSEEKGSVLPISLVSHGQEMNSLRDMLCRVRWVCYLLADFACLSLYN